MSEQHAQQHQQPQCLAEAIVTQLAQAGGWDWVYQRLHLGGMTLRAPREKRGF